MKEDIRAILTTIVLILFVTWCFIGIFYVLKEAKEQDKKENKR